MRRLSLNRSEPAKKSGQNIPKNRCRTTIAERMVETPAELPFIGDQLVLSHDQAARGGPRKEARGWSQAMHSNRSVHRLEIGATTAADRSDSNSAAGQQ
jgi:hypothetical protein